MNETTKRGGPRKGAGLAADAGGVKTKKHTVTLDAFTVAFLELLGNGNLSRGIREAARKLAPKKTPPNVDLYRLLTRKDRIERDDEFLSDDCETWRIDPLHLFAGMEYCPGALLPARRKLTPNT